MYSRKESPIEATTTVKELGKSLDTFVSLSCPTRHLRYSSVPCFPTFLAQLRVVGSISSGTWSSGKVLIVQFVLDERFNEYFSSDG
jgi:hypothetical protein